MSVEHRVLAEVLYIARMAPDWQAQPYWLLRRCVVPYVAAQQFLVLRQEGVPVAFVGWVFEAQGQRMPWRDDQYLPSVTDFSAAGECCITELISPMIPVEQVVTQVMRWLKLEQPPRRIEVNAERRIVAVHPPFLSTEGAT
jgi:hemolysin-activating ACP:hemolysin acyltransferase